MLFWFKIFSDSFCSFFVIVEIFLLVRKFLLVFGDGINLDIVKNDRK